MRILRTALIPFVCTIFPVCTVSAQTSASVCTAFLSKPIFTNSTIKTSTASRDSFKRLQCASDWKSAQEAQAAGIEATIPIFDLPVPFTANWNQQKVEQWKSANCSNEEKNSASNLSYYSAVYAIDPITAKAALECFDRGFKADADVAQASALRCTLTETQSAYVFEARWRRTAGETGSPPQVVSFTPVNTNCLDAGSLAKDKFISEGGVPVLCTVSEKAAAFALTTTRGGCSASAAVRLPKLQIPKEVILSEPLFISGQEVEIAANAKIVTNGFPLTIRADKLNLLGPVKIVSFDSVAATTPTPGKFAGNIQITASEFLGQGLTILNAGQGGGPGLTGQKGPQGSYGGPGEGRTTTQTRVCGNIPLISNVCNLVPTGCEGGRNGGDGGQGGAGYPGTSGFPGGGAGDVTIDVPFDARKYISVLTNVGLDGQSRQCSGQICGGLGGQGGPGGPGGDGGPGGPGAPGTVYCGGTNAGQSGPVGPGGPQGPRGTDGPNAAVRG